MKHGLTTNVNVICYHYILKYSGTTIQLFHFFKIRLNMHLQAMVNYYIWSTLQSHQSVPQPSIILIFIFLCSLLSVLQDLRVKLLFDHKSLIHFILQLNNFWWNDYSSTKDEFGHAGFEYIYTIRIFVSRQKPTMVSTLL